MDIDVTQEQDIKNKSSKFGILKGFLRISLEYQKSPKQEKIPEENGKPCEI